jgi:hypothetical protein
MRLAFLSIVALTSGLFQAQALDSVPNWGASYNCKVKIAADVSRKTFAKLPANLDVYSIGRTPFPAEGIKLVIDCALGDSDEGKALKERVDADAHVLAKEKVVLKDDEHGRLVVDPINGILLFTRNGHDAPKVPLTNVPSAALGFDAFTHTMRELAGKLHIQDAEIARKPNGDYQLLVSDNQRFPHHQKQPILYERSVTYSRRTNGFAMSSGYTSFFQIVLERFVSGQWSRILVYWPTLKPAGSCRLYSSNREITEAILSGKSLWDYNNEFDSEDVKKVEVNDLRIVYATLKDGLSVPVMCLDCTMKTNHGTKYGVLFLPLEKNP